MLGRYTGRNNNNSNQALLPVIALDKIQAIIVVEFNITWKHTCRKEKKNNYKTTNSALMEVMTNIDE